MKNIKIYYLLYIISLLIVACSGPEKKEQKERDNYLLEVFIDNPPSEYLYKTIFSNEPKSVIDSVPYQQGKFVFEGSVENPVEARLFFKNEEGIKTDRGTLPKPMLVFILSNDHIKVEGDPKNFYASRVTDNSHNQAWLPVFDITKPMEITAWGLTKQFNAEKEGSEEKKEILGQLQPLRKEISTLHKDYMLANPNTFNAIKIAQRSRLSLKLEELNKVYESLGESLKHTPDGIALEATINNIEKTAIGNSAPLFSSVTLHKDQVSLDDFRGKYVLLDFWGSWCSPCRQSHPHLIEIYHEYKNKGLEIIAVSHENGPVERQEKSWKAAIEKDQIDLWVHILNNKEDESLDIVKSYGISAFPTKLLIDPDGKIIYKSIGATKEIDEKLQEILG